MKIAIISDIHEGINRKNTQTDIMFCLKEQVWKQQPEIMIISGDMTNGPEKSLKLLKQLQEDCPKTKVLYVHGNHDVHHRDADFAYDLLLQFPGNLGNGPVVLNEDWVVIGDGGWYDYSLGVEGFTKDQFSAGTFNGYTWPDKTHVHWKKTDQDHSDHYVQRISNWLQEYQDKNIIMVTHVVPFSRFVICKNDPGWDFFNAMMGSERLGELAVKYGVKKYIFGHIHQRYHEMYNGMEVIGNPLGYYPHEWDFTSAEKEISSVFKIIEI